MNSKERLKAMSRSDSLPELLSSACDVDIEKARNLQSRINSIESFLEDNGFSRGKPKKMAILYIMMRYGHTPRTVEKWWGKTESSYNSFSEDLGHNYLEDLKEFINDRVEFEEEEDWTPGDELYDSKKDPFNEYFDIEDEGRNAKITSFGQ
jgi:hypothetical protein